MYTLYVFGVFTFFIWFVYNTYIVESMLTGNTKAVTESDKLNIENRKKMIKEMQEVAGDKYKNLYWLVIGVTGIVASLVWPITLGVMLGMNNKK